MQLLQTEVVGVRRAWLCSAEHVEALKPTRGSADPEFPNLVVRDVFTLPSPTPEYMLVIAHYGLA